MKDQIVMDRPLDQNISKTAALVGCSRSAVVSIYQKWSKEGTVVNRRQGHGRPRLIDARGERRPARVVRSNRRATVAQIAEEVNAGSDRKVSEYTVHDGVVVDLELIPGTFSAKQDYTRETCQETTQLFQGKAQVEVKRSFSEMVSAGMQMLGAALGVLGWIGVIVVCALPMWRVTAFIGNNIVTSQIQWEGIWMNCVVQSTGQMQCKVYDSMLALSSDLQAARALTVISVVVGIMGILLAMAGGKCTNCIEDEKSKGKVAVVAGIIFIISGILCLIPVCWTAQTVIRDFYNPLVNQAQKRELGASLFIGWGAAALLIIGGALLCTSCPREESTKYTAKYSAPARSQASAPSNKDYV
ncbi:hypothetical protein QTP86_025621 [Hemibagrus guttatus]|nr:hypothetical protein QTP86_025621 [Hemibagrus guttatus]